MPIYEYKCDECDHRHDEIRSYELRDQVTVCERCGHESFRVEAAKTFFSLRGDGWTDPSGGMR